MNLNLQPYYPKFQGGGGGGGGELSAGGVVFWDDEMARSVIAAAERVPLNPRLQLPYPYILYPNP